MTESTFIIIPLLITFLSVLQLGVGALSRGAAENRVQAAITRTVIDGNDSLPADVTVNRFAMPGGGALVVGKSNIHGITVTPLLPNGDNFVVSGYSIEES